MPRAIPDRWIPYKACGKIIEGTRIICFKVPLRRNVQTSVQEIKEIWDITALLAAIPKLGFVIDLTNTDRYYDPKLLNAAGVQHKKIFIPGRIIPPADKVSQFMNTVDEFLAKNNEQTINHCTSQLVKYESLSSWLLGGRVPSSFGTIVLPITAAIISEHGAVIFQGVRFVKGVHCTHGLNRTGYMVCRYMRDRLGIPADEAIKRFEVARGYQIERENYLADLRGKPPPPPDIGTPTAIKPVQYKNSITYQSPLNEYDYEDSYKSREKLRDSDRRYNNKREYSRNYEQDGQSSTKYNSTFGKSSASRRKRNTSESSCEFNYAYDY